ncbi:MAG: 3'(2'),5'-bisphosphate nucleotidase CysQ [Coprobacillus sp.]|nr:3'(2'),5'-bisphosphate nucleotidase CysQ [Coprobacillus sp.]
MYHEELETAIKCARHCQKIILDVYYNENFTVETKSDNSPVTIADTKSDQYIRKTLSKAYPTYGLLTEECEDDLSRLDKEYVWIADPLDGTKDFVAKDDGFVINIALIHKHEIVLGVVCIPALDQIYWAIKGEGAYKRVNDVDIPIHVNNKKDNLLCLASVFHFTEAEGDLIKKHSDVITRVAQCGSSIKAVRIAEGEAEISYRLNPNTKEWDTAAPEIIVREAGGVYVKPDHTNYEYNRKDVYNREGYIIANCLENVLL